MADTQLEIAVTVKPKFRPEEVEKLKSILRGRGWMTAALISAIAADQLECTWGERVVRALAAASKGQVISGQEGYKLTTEATIEEIQHASSWLRHQADEMKRRAIDIDRVYHAKQP